MRNRNGGLTFRSRKAKFSRSIIYEIITWFFAVAIAVFIAFVSVWSLGIRTAVIGPSMEPTLYNGQEIIMNRVQYLMSAPKRNDVIVFRPRGDESAHFYVKRVIGLPGETIQIKQGRVYIDNELFLEDVVPITNDPGIAQEEITLSVDEYFVMGDNRDNSEDSRSANIGNVNRDMIEGKAWYHLEYGKESAGRIE